MSDYVFHRGALLGLHRRLHADVFVPSGELHAEMWCALPSAERDALLMLTLVTRHTEQWPSMALCVEIALAFNANAGVVCAGFGYMPRRAATSEERDAYELCRQIATAAYCDVKRGVH